MDEDLRKRYIFKNQIKNTARVNETSIQFFCALSKAK